MAESRTAARQEDEDQRYWQRLVARDRAARVAEGQTSRAEQTQATRVRQTRPEGRRARQGMTMR
jgi:hypothetical protein